MSHNVVITNRHVIGVYSFTTGFVASPRPTLKTEDDILNHAHYLERRGYQEEALAFLERHCPKK